MKVHDCNKNVKIEKVRGDKMLVTIKSSHARDREFTILIDEQGLNIKANDQITMTPSSATSVKIDYRD